MSSISPTQSNVQAALKSFLSSVLPAFGSDGKPLQVIAAVQNRVPEPAGTSFVLMTPIRIERLETNIDSFSDTRFTGSIGPATANFTASIAGTAMAVTGSPSGGIAVGAAITGAGVAPGTIVTAQTSGPQGGAGTYTVAPPQNVASESMSQSYGIMIVTAVQIGQVAIGSSVFGPLVAAGTIVTQQIGSSAVGQFDVGVSPIEAASLGIYAVNISQTITAQTLASGATTSQQNAKFTVQLDFHTADETASDLAQIVSTLLRDDYGVNFFAGLAPPLNSVAPLYADDPRYMPFINEAQQYEWRWVVEAALQANQVTTSPMQYADLLSIVLKPQA